MPRTMSLKGNGDDSVLGAEAPGSGVVAIDTMENQDNNTSSTVETAENPPVDPAAKEQEAAATTTTTTTTTPTPTASVPVVVPCWYPKCCGKPLFRGNKEALGYALDLMARSTTFACAGAFLLPALLNLAKLEAGCAIDDAPGDGSSPPPSCEGKVYGIRPSSLLTTILTIVGVVSAALLPIMGAIVDTTPYRRLIGRILAPMLCGLLIPTIMVNENNWFAISIIFIILSFLAWSQAMINYAYLPELTQDQAILNEYTRGISILSFSFIVVFLATVVAVSAGLNLMNDYVTVARISQSMTFSLLTICTILSYGFLYGPRPAAHERPRNGKSVWTAGFIQLYETIQKIHAHYPALQWYYCAIALSNSAIGSLLVINMTFLTDQLLFSSQTIGTCVTIMLLFSIPGAIVSFYFNKWLNPVKSSISSLVLMIIVTTVVSIVLKEPGQQVEAYILSGAWGVAMGWNFTCDRMVISSIIPKNQEAELMALFLFAGQCLNWLPPLIYTSMNEANISPRIGIAMLNIFFALGIICYILMGSYDQALATAISSRNTA
jgi:MFS-type transporter involved in bile tolerance (Atg22 family)